MFVDCRSIFGGMLLQTYIALAAAGAIFVAYVFNAYKNKSLPPGPKGLPIIGNLLDLAVDDIWVKYRDWGKQYGDVMTVKILGTPMIILNSAEGVNDLMEQRGSNYSDRPDLPMVVDLMGWDWTFALMRYGPRWREHRRVFHSHFHARSGQHQIVAKEAANAALLRLLHTPADFLGHLKQFTAAIILKRVYGHTVTDMNDPYVQLVEEASKSTSLATIPGAFFVDIFPSMKHIPEWILPGGGFKKKAREWRKLSQAMVEVPYKMVKDRLKSGIATPCFVTTCLEDNANPDSKAALREDLIKHTAAVAYAAGADTTLSALTNFMLAMTLNPEVVAHAQAELDSVTGGERLPTFEDKDRLPYITAILKEVLRWIPVLPLSVPHRTMKDDHYRGYYIPAGTNIVPNVWAIFHNEEVFENPSKFNPDRFMKNPDLPDPADNGFFGFGRRSCAGKGMALDTLWIAMASILAAFDISKELDEHGSEITPEGKMGPGTISHLLPFESRIRPRSKEWAGIIRRANGEHY